MQGAAAEAFEAAGGVGKGHAGDDAHIAGGARAEQEAFDRPIDDADAVAIARAENQVGILGRLDEAGDVVGVMGEIAVHLHDEFVTRRSSAQAKPAQ